MQKHFGPLAQVIQGSQTRTFTRDWMGRIIQEGHPETGTTSYSYDNGGLVSSRTDARNITTSYTYDDIGRPLTVAYSDSTPDISYDYDQNGFTGFLTSVDVDLVTASTFEYFTNAGFLKKETVTLDGVGSFAAEYTYDYDGRLLTAKYPSGRIVTQTYDSGGGVASDRLASLTDNPTSATLVQAIEDNAAGQITNRTLSTSITETRTFNARNQLQRIAASANSATLLDMSYGYGYGNDGRIRSRTDAVQPEHSANYIFDEIGRLKEVSGGDSSWGISWGIDRYGNRTSQSPLGLASGRVGSQSLGYTNNKNTSFTYDDAGNLTYDGTYHYYYDAENRLYQIESSAIQYAYDAGGRRIRKAAGGVTTYYFYGLTGLMSEFSTASGATGAAATDRLQYRIGEQTGTAVMLVGADGTPRENNRVFPFGEAWVSFVASNNSEKFTTYQHDNDASSDLDYAMARYYASRSGRFMTADPGHVGANVGDPQSWNAYVYSRNDPVNLVDPSGTKYQICPANAQGAGCEGGFELSDIGFDRFVAIGGYTIDGSYLSFGFDDDPVYYFMRTSIDPFDSGPREPRIGTRNPATPRQEAIIDFAVKLLFERVRDYEQCRNAFGGLETFLKTVASATIDLSSNSDPLRKSEPIGYMYGQSNGVIAFTMNNYVLLNDRRPGWWGKAPGFFNLNTEARAQAIGHEFLHVGGNKHSGRRDFTGIRSGDRLSIDCFLADPARSINWKK